MSDSQLKSRFKEPLNKFIVILEGVKRLRNLLNEFNGGIFLATLGMTRIWTCSEVP